MKPKLPIKVFESDSTSLLKWDPHFDFTFCFKKK